MGGAPQTDELLAGRPFETTCDDRAVLFAAGGDSSACDLLALFDRFSFMHWKWCSAMKLGSTLSNFCWHTKHDTLVFSVTSFG